MGVDLRPTPRSPCSSSDRPVARERLDRTMPNWVGRCCAVWPQGWSAPAPQRTSGALEKTAVACRLRLRCCLRCSSVQFTLIDVASGSWPITGLAVGPQGRGAPICRYRYPSRRVKIDLLSSGGRPHTPRRSAMYVSTYSYILCSIARTMELSAVSIEQQSSSCADDSCHRRLPMACPLSASLSILSPHHRHVCAERTE